MEFPNKDWASEVAEEKRAWERTWRRGTGWPGHSGAGVLEKRRDIPVVSVLEGGQVLNFNIDLSGGILWARCLGGFRVIGTLGRNSGGMWSKVSVGINPGYIPSPDSLG